MTQEQIDLQHMKDRQNELKLEAFDAMEMLLELTPEALSESGFKSTSDALETTMRDSVRKCHNLAKMHVKKYPDNRP